jgi:diguanylate cyclase (GGDEF) domain
MKKEFTRSELDQLISSMKDEYDVVRLVDPVDRKVLAEDSFQPTGEICHSIWGKDERCENCTSLRALQSMGVAYKLEMIDKKTFWVTSRFVWVDNQAMILEMVQDTTGELIMDSNQRDQIGKLISSYNEMLITDPLTGVYNRRFLDEHFVPSLQCCHEDNITVNMAFIDMDGFKTINDKYGHSAGDQVLRDAAGFWKLHFNDREKGKERLVIRYGGDELIIIACGILKDDFKRQIDQYYREMRKICYLEDDQFDFDFSYGIASSSTVNNQLMWEDLLKMADKDMYEKKQQRHATENLQTVKI